MAGARGAVGAKGAKGTGTRLSPLPQRGTSKPPYEERDPIPYWHEKRFGNRLEDAAAEAAEVVKLQRRKNELEEEIKTKQTVIRALMEDINKKESWSVRDDDWVIAYVKPNKRKTLVPELLIQQGVKQSVIEKATRETPVTPFVTVQARKPQGGQP